MLEWEGAQKLKSVWPLEGIDIILEIFDEDTAAYFNEEAQRAIGNMLQGLRAVCKPILNAQPLPDLYSSVGPATTLYASMPQQQQPIGATNTPPPQQTGEQVKIESPPGVNAGRNFNSFSAFATATSPPNDQSQAPVSVFAGAASSLASAAPASVLAGAASAPAGPITFSLPVGTGRAPGSFLGGASSTPSATGPSNPKADSILSYMNANILDFQANVARLLKDGHLSTAPRKENEDILETMQALAGGETGFLGVQDGMLFKREVESLVRKIANLSNRAERNKQTTRNIDVLAHEILKLWA
jgi:hypothetical protein